ncbi:MAG: helix-turn-helix domain-containing protein [Firmicutes bacterium]|nr:helix-turn-helix domain-containing protein [Bacillota bacterium]
MMNIADVATVLGISRAGAYKLAHDSRFPAFQIGKRIVVSREKFLDWLDRQCEEQKCA